MNKVSYLAGPAGTIWILHLCVIGLVSSCMIESPIGIRDYARPKPALTPHGHLSKLFVLVTPEGEASGLEVAFSRSISGRASHYLWRGSIDDGGRTIIQLNTGRRSASGYYSAILRDAQDEVLGRWTSIPINGGRDHEISLPIGGSAYVAETHQRTGQSKPQP